jgi:hypothetical protein
MVVIAVLLAALGPQLARQRRTHRDVAGQVPSGDIEFLDPRELLFSIPTLNDGLPAVDPDAHFARESAAALLHEDDWRQEEFTPVGNREFVRQVLAQLDSHRAVHAQGLGFREVHVRDEPSIRLESLGLAPGDIRAVVGSSRVPLYLNGTQPSRVRGGFAMILKDVGYLYGQEVDGVVTALGLGLVGSGLGDVASLGGLTERYGLLFVDWIRGVVIEPGDTHGFRRWLDAIIYPEADI